MKELANSHLENLGIHSLNEMQHETQRAILKNENVLLLSPTGSGKTIAFLYPLIQLLEKDNKEIQCLIIVPTRELGLQIEEVWKKLKTNFKINFFYGGHSYKTELENLKNAPAVLIATPGRLA
ncbi:MAG: DEAD/DEAH box helicase family protein, partial [Solirubrobacteraceae bacterium]